MSHTTFATTGESRFVLARGPVGYGYHLEIRVGGEWKRVTAEQNSFISGTAFDLRPALVESVGDGLAISGSRDGDDGTAFSWHGMVNPVRGSTWFHVEITIDSSGFRIGEHGAIEPQLSLNLGDLPPYERGDHVWFKTLVENPTQWNGEGRGNDFPALCYYDPYLGARFRMFFDMTPMTWMGVDTIARFYGYGCGFRRLYHGRPSAELGLLAHAQSGHDFPAGPQRFSWYVSADGFDAEPTPPTEQDALRELVDACLPLLPSKAGYWPAGAASWADFAGACADDLMNTAHSWGSDDDGEYLLAYVDGRSDAWDVTMAARGRVHSGDEPCLEAALWALRPIDALRSALPNAPYADLHSRLERFVRAEIKRERSSVLGGRTKDRLPMGTWQYVYIVAELWFLFAYRDDEAVLARILHEIDTVTVPLAVNTHHQFPLQFDKSTLRKIGPGSAYAVAGTYALLMLAVAQRTGDDRYLQQARSAIRALANVPIDHALQEVVLIAHALDAADRLFELTGEPEWQRAREYFRAQTLRMMYWYDDKTSARTAQSSQLGMFLACANINYPAFFENIEADARLAATIHAEADPSASLRILDYGRRTNFSFFPRCSPDMYGSMPLDFIPFEDVPILEGPNNAGFLGQEIYGAGFTFRAHLLWDAYAAAIDPELMVLNLDSYRERAHNARGWSGSFLVFNGGEKTLDTEIFFPIVGDGDRAAITMTSPAGVVDIQSVRGRQALEVSVEAGGWFRMTVDVRRGDGEHDDAR